MARRVQIRLKEPPAPTAPEVETFDVVQGTEEWFALRRGIPTASRFKDIMAEGDGKSRLGYLCTLAGEIVTGVTATSFRNDDMDRGNADEPAAREWYGRSRLASLAQVGFVRRLLPSGRYVGCSPDSLVDSDRILEIKSLRTDLLIAMRETGKFPTQHRAQCHGSLWVTGRRYCDLVLWSGALRPLVFELERDDVYIKQISNAVEIFDFDLDRLVRRERGAL